MWSPVSEAIWKDVERRGFAFVGPVTVYAWTQAVGVVNDHASDCFRRDDDMPKRGEALIVAGLVGMRVEERTSQRALPGIRIVFTLLLCPIRGQAALNHLCRWPKS